MPNSLSNIRFLDFSEVSGFRYETMFDSIDGYTKILTGGGLISLGDGHVQMTGGTGAGDKAELRKPYGYHHWISTYLKKRVIQAQIYFEFTLNGSDDNQFCTGFPPDVCYGFGFTIKSDRITGWSGGVPDITEIDLITGLVAPWQQAFNLKAIFYPNARIEFLVDMIPKGVITTDLPEGDDEYLGPLFWRVSEAPILRHVMQFSTALFFQDV